VHPGGVSWRTEVSYDRTAPGQGPLYGDVIRSIGPILMGPNNASFIKAIAAPGLQFYLPCDSSSGSAILRPHSAPDTAVEYYKIVYVQGCHYRNCAYYDDINVNLAPAACGELVSGRSLRCHDGTAMIKVGFFLR